MEMVQPVGKVIDNPIRLEKGATEAVVKELDTHLGSLVALFHQYYKHHWLVKGPQFRELHLFFEGKYKEVQEDLDAVAERMTMLGGVPTSSLEGQAKKSFIKSEEEGDHPIREMVQKDMSDEGLLIERLRDTIELVQKHRDYGSEYLLKGILYRAENRAHELEHFLELDSLDKGAKVSH